MKLRPYQIKTIDDVLAGFNGKTRQLIVLPTGSGKTVIFSHIAERLKKKTLIIAHTKELIDQANKTMRSIVKSCSFDIMSIQKAQNKTTIQDLHKEGYELLIIDECHRSGAMSYQKVIDALPGVLLLGVTATPFRQDGVKIYDIFGRPTCSLSILDMIKEGFLCDFEGYRIKTDCSLKGISTRKGEFQSHKLASVINVKNRNELIVREFKNICPKDKTLVFTANIKHAQNLEKEFVANGFSCKAIHGELPSNLRKQMITDFKSGRIQILINCQILTEGFDEPSIECLLMARPTLSKVLYLQMIGRGARTWPGKECCKVIEFTDNDYDVCAIEEILDANTRKYPIRSGERITKFSDRIKKDLLEDAQNTIREKLYLTPKSVYEKPASAWQRSYLLEKKIPFHEPLSDYMANYLICEESNGTHPK